MKSISKNVKQIRAKEKTWLKKSTAMSWTLSVSEKVLIQPDHVLEIEPDGPKNVENDFLHKTVVLK